MKKILVTGGAGYIGSHTVKELVRDGFEVVVVDNLEAGHKELVSPKAKLEIADLADKKKLEKIFQRYQSAAVIDFVAYSAVGESMEKPKKYFKNNVANFINLLDVMNKSGCKYIVKSSTAAIYGNPRNDKDIPWKEEFTENYRPKKSALLAGKWQGKTVEGEEFFQKFINYYQTFYKKRPELKLSKDEIGKLRIPMSIYGLTKLLDEVLLKKYDKLFGIKFVALRYFNVCGDDPDGEVGEFKPKPTTLTVLAIDQILGNRPKLTVFGNDYPTPDGTGIRDYIHPSDLAVGHILSLKYLFNKKPSAIFNHATGDASTVLQVIKSVEKASGKKVKYAIGPRRSGDVSISIADSSKANKILGWKAKYRLDEMSKTAWNWHSKLLPKLEKKK